MKTKFWPTLVIGGILLTAASTFNLLIIIFAILSVGYGFKLRRLAKKGIKDTKDKEGIAKLSKQKNESKYCGWSTAALIFAFLGGWIGIILGIIALFKIKKNPNLRGKGRAIAAIIIAIPMMFIWIFISVFFSVLDPMALLPEESQMKSYCEEICLEEHDLENSYVEINPGNQSQYLCSCLDSDDYIIAQYEAPLGFSKISKKG